jgi:hypothetical protein
MFYEIWIRIFYTIRDYEIIVTECLIRVHNSRVIHKFRKSHDSSVGIALGYKLDDRGSRFRFPAGTENFLFTTVSRTALGPTQPPIQCVPGALSLRVKRSGCESDHSIPCSAEVKE